MYRKRDKNQLEFVDDFFLPFGGKLDKRNRWVRLAEIIPWDKVEEEYISLFSDMGAPAKPVRMALGALIIKEKMGFSDIETMWKRHRKSEPEWYPYVSFSDIINGTNANPCVS